MPTVSDPALLPGRWQDLASALDWERACTGQHNVLLVGPDDLTTDFVGLLEPYLRQPVVWRTSPASIAFPAGDCGTLVLQNVGALGREEQADLLRWLNDPDEHRQVVSTTACPLFPLVERGLFDDVLYYRLNVMLHCMESGRP